MSDAERIEQIRQRCEKATEGPWEYEYLGCNRSTIGCPKMPRLFYCIECGWQSLQWSNSDDGKFTAHAREDIPWLLSLIETLCNGYMELAQGHGIDSHISAIAEVLRVLREAKDE